MFWATTWAFVSVFLTSLILIWTFLLAIRLQLRADALDVGALDADKDARPRSMDDDRDPLRMAHDLDFGDVGALALGQFDNRRRSPRSSCKVLA